MEVKGVVVVDRYRNGGWPLLPEREESGRASERERNNWAEQCRGDDRQ
jgi:hypothetical protein